GGRGADRRLRPPPHGDRRDAARRARRLSRAAPGGGLPAAPLLPHPRLRRRLRSCARRRGPDPRDGRLRGARGADPRRDRRADRGARARRRRPRDLPSRTPGGPLRGGRRAPSRRRLPDPRGGRPGPGGPGGGGAAAGSLRLMRAPVRIAAISALAATALSAPFWGPAALRRVGWFEVRRVEVSGTRLLAPHLVLAASGIRSGQSVWDDPQAWEEALRAHPAIADARVVRRLPQTLRVRVEEKRPVAFVEAGSLRPATASGEILPVDPARTPVDLPIVRGTWS